MAYLEACRECGTEPEQDVYIGRYKRELHRIYCPNMYCDVKPKTIDDDVDVAAIRWNAESIDDQNRNNAW